MDKLHARAALAAQRSETLARLDELESADWERPCLPGWTVHDVVAHLVTLDEAAVTGRVLPLLRTLRDHRELERWNDESVRRWRDATPEELRDALARWGERVDRLVASVPQVVLRRSVRGPYGRQPLLYMAYRRVLDEWVHSCDLAASTAADEPRPPPVVSDALAVAVLRVLPQLSLARASHSVGVVRLVVEAGTDEAALSWSVDFARRHYGPRVTRTPDAVIVLSAATLALLHEHRLEWRSAGTRVRVEGDVELAAVLLDSLPPRSDGQPGPGPLLY